MKKFFRVLTCLTLALCLLASSLLVSNPVSAAETTVSEETIQLDDGDYCVITTTETVIPSIARGKTKTKTAQKSYKYYNASNVLSWEYTLYGTFMYDDYLVVCSDVVHEIIIKNPRNWIYDEAKRWKSGNTAYGRAVFRLLTTSAKKTVNLQISCTKHGVIS